MNKSSAISGFYKLTPNQRLEKVKEFSNLSDEECEILQNMGSLPIEVADHMIENVIGSFTLPLGIAVNFLINDRNYLIPMAIEEPSVVAAASNAAKMVRSKGGFHTNSTSSIMIGQIQTVNIVDPHAARQRVLIAKDKILSLANEQDPVLNSFGGGAKDVDSRVIKTSQGEMLITELYVDCQDAMGANAVNTMCEAVAPLIQEITGGWVYLRILSNLATKRLARAWCTVSKETVGGQEVVDGIINAAAFAETDPYRGATHNKGAMNGIIAVTVATGNDHRAIEAGAHAYAAKNGNYTTLTRWEKDQNGDLSGSIELPMAVGLVGGAVKTHPTAKIALKILNVKTAKELSEVLAAVGLAQNLAALRALSHEGIQKGHMSLHARNVAIQAGAAGKFVDLIAQIMTKEHRIRVDRAKELLVEMKAN